MTPRRVRLTPRSIDAKRDDINTYWMRAEAIEAMGPPPQIECRWGSCQRMARTPEGFCGPHAWNYREMRESGNGSSSSGGGSMASAFPDEGTPTLCAIDWCNRHARYKGYCNPHAWEVYPDHR